VAKAEWGLKRTCLSCGARFYDLQREPIVCPACGAAVDGAGPSKPRRSRAAAVPARAAAVPAAAEVEVVVANDEVADDDIDLETEADEDEAVEKEVADDEAEEDGESAIEDVSELGDDDMADVIDTEIDEEETDR
jgi:uncharacterized protein (TIGR02300 family)